MKDFRDYVFQKEIRNASEIIVKDKGIESQLSQTQEELAELIVAISKVKRFGTETRLGGLIEEIADVEFMCEQLKCFFGIHGEVNSVKRSKVDDRLKEVARHD